MPGACLNSWRIDGCEWTVRYLWRWMDWITRLDVIVLALLLGYVVVVVFYGSRRYHLARRAGEIGDDTPATHRNLRELVADLNFKAGNIKSIGSAAPYLGLAGTCVGMLGAFRGIGMEKHAAMARITTYIAASMITSAAGLVVAVPAVWSYNYLRVQIEILESELPRPAKRDIRCFQIAANLPLARRFSQLPFAIIAAPALAILLVAWAPFFNPRVPKGLSIELASPRCYGGDGLPIVLSITDAGKLFLNTEQESQSALSGHLSEIYKMRAHRTLYLLADDGVRFQAVADALDAVESASGMGTDKLSTRVQLLTPALSAACPSPIVTIPRHPRGKEP